MVTVTAEDGYVTTPEPVADFAASWLFVDPPSADDRILYPGAGDGNLAAAVERYCSVRDLAVPDAVAVEKDSGRADQFRDRFSDNPAVPDMSQKSRHRLTPVYPPGTSAADAPVGTDATVYEADFLLEPPEVGFDYILANPPYLRYKDMDTERRDLYRDGFETASGQFDLYMPFVEQMLDLLSDDGWLAFIAPDRYLTLEAAAPLRVRLRRESPKGFISLPDEAFPDHQVSTMVTLVRGDASPDLDGSFWLEALYGYQLEEMLDGLGVAEADIDKAKDRYYTSYRKLDQQLRAARRRLGPEGGYNPAVDPIVDHEFQAELERWSL